MFKRRNFFDGDPLLGHGVHGGNDNPVGALAQELERVIPRTDLKTTACPNSIKKLS